MLIASRFHAMISALYKNVPVFLIGWGHKYKEVLDMFGHGGYAVDYRSLNLDLLKNKFELFEKDINSLRWKISENIEEVKKSAMKNIDIIVDSLNSR
jgi:polysaccharide pyruvyl transferase WcaK-like protein